jgi:hypothetical protein
LDELLKEVSAYEYAGAKFKAYSSFTPSMMKNWLSLSGYKHIHVKVIIPIHTNDMLKFRLYRLVLRIVCALMPRLMPGIYCGAQKCTLIEKDLF